MAPGATAIHRDTLPVSVASLLFPLASEPGRFPVAILIRTACGFSMFVVFQARNNIFPELKWPLELLRGARAGKRLFPKHPSWCEGRCGLVWLRRVSTERK